MKLARNVLFILLLLAAWAEPVPAWHDSPTPDCVRWADLMEELAEMRAQGVPMPAAMVQVSKVMEGHREAFRFAISLLGWVYRLPSGITPKDAGDAVYYVCISRL